MELKKFLFQLLIPAIIFSVIIGFLHLIQGLDKFLNDKASYEDVIIILFLYSRRKYIFDHSDK
jgi:hypothetical protein